MTPSEKHRRWNALPASRRRELRQALIEMGHLGPEDEVDPLQFQAAFFICATKEDRSFTRTLTHCRIAADDGDLPCMATGGFDCPAAQAA